jgi:hypothetical protein
MSQPDYLICLNCESPCYVFEWREGKLAEPLCEACGNDDPDEFATPEDYEAILDS